MTEFVGAQIPLKQALGRLTSELQNNPAYAHSWYCNLKFKIVDAVTAGQEVSHDEYFKEVERAGLAAEHIMKSLLGYKGDVPKDYPGGPTETEVTNTDKEDEEGVPMRATAPYIVNPRWA